MKRPRQQPSTDLPSGSGKRGTLARAAKLVAGNVIVFVALLLVVNLLSGLAIYGGRALNSRLFGRTATTDEDPRIAMPNYPDRAYSRLLWREIKLGVFYEPFVEWKHQPFRGKTLTVNADGARVHPGQVSASQTGGRVVRFFGGSTMYGVGADDAGTIPAQFNKLEPAAEVHNHGTSGSNTRQDLERLINLINLGQQSDVVVFYGGVNDIASMCRTDVSINGHGEESRMRSLLGGFDRPVGAGGNGGRGYAPRGTLRGFLHDMFLRHTAQVVRLAADKLGVSSKRNETETFAATYACARDPERARHVAETVAQNLTYAHDLVTARKGTFIAILQPHAYISRTRLNHIKTYLEDEEYKSVGDQHRVVYPMLQQILGDKPWWYQMLDAFDRDEYLYVDVHHVSANGNAIIAQRVKELVG